MRLFIAVDVDAATRCAAVSLQDAVRHAVPSVDRALRWVAPANLHMTLQFLGERKDVEVVERALKPAFAQGAFDLRWASPAWLPSEARARVLYVAVADGARQLSALARETATRLQPLGVEPEGRPFVPHLTLARVREQVDRTVLRRVQSSVEPRPFADTTTMRVDAIVLYESRVAPNGPTYHQRARTPLTGRREQ